MEEQERFVVLHPRIMHLNEIIRVAVNQEKVRVAIIIIVKKSQSPATQKLRGRAYFARFIRKSKIFLIVIKAEKLLLDVSYKKVLPAITVKVHRIDSHSRTRL